MTTPGARQLRRVLSAVALRVPPTVGPQRWRRFAARARVEHALRRADDDPDEALSLLQPALSTDATARRALSSIIGSFEKRGQTRVALVRARHAVETGTSELALLVSYLELARREDSESDVRRAMTAIAAHCPRSQAECDRTASILRFADLDLARGYLDLLTAHAQTRGFDREAVHAAIDELALLEAHEGHDSSEVSRLTRSVIDHRAHALRILASVAVRRRAWADLVDLITAYDANELGGVPAGSQKFPSSQVEIAARNAFRDGVTSSAAWLADRALRERPGAPGMAALRDEARDQLTTTSWEVPARQPVAYEARPRAVLSLLGQSLPIRSGGYATRSHGLLTGLAGRGWDMYAATRLGFPFDLWWKADDPRTVAPVDVVDGISYHRLLTPGVRTYPRYPLTEYVEQSAQMVSHLATEHRAALIHAASLHDVGLVGLAAARKLGIPFIYEMRGLKQLLEGARNPQFVGSERHDYLDRMEATVARNADAVLVITEALGRQVAAMGVPEERIHVVPNGVHTELFEPRERDGELEAELGLTGKTVIGYAGGIVHYEGLELLLEAAASLARTGREDFHVLIVGDGSHDRLVRRRSAELGLDDAVTFTGRVPHEDVQRYLSLIDIAPFPRLPLPVCELISPIKPFESMAMGKAVVVSDVAAMAEFVADGETGRTFTKGDAADLVRVLSELLDDPVQRRNLGQAARSWVIRERDWSTITHVVDGVYQQLLGTE